MLYKIQENFYIDLEQILFVDKAGDDLRIFFRNHDSLNSGLILVSDSVAARKFVEILDTYLEGTY